MRSFCPDLPVVPLPTPWRRQTLAVAEVDVRCPRHALGRDGDGTGGRTSIITTKRTHPCRMACSRLRGRAPDGAKRNAESMRMRRARRIAGGTRW
jgi:hypothetical protein